MQLITPNEMMQYGIFLVGFSLNAILKMSPQRQEGIFHSHYGSSQLAVANMWYDLTTTKIPESKLNDDEKNHKGAKRFLVALHFLFVYPRNAQAIATLFKQNIVYSRGEAIWLWVRRIQGLKAKVIRWPDALDDPDSEVFVVSVDGVDMKVWEQKHPTLPHDRKYFSKKFNHAGVKYELGVSIFGGDLVWMNGPFKAGVHDLTIFRNGLRQKLADGKMAIADRGYRTSKPDEMFKLAIPVSTDSNELRSFKSRCRARHETFNSRIKNFRVLSDTYRHDIRKHQSAFQAVCVIVQYQIRNGAPLFVI